MIKLSQVFTYFLYGLGGLIGYFALAIPFGIVVGKALKASAEQSTRD